MACWGIRYKLVRLRWKSCRVMMVSVNIRPGYPSYSIRTQWGCYQAWNINIKRNGLPNGCWILNSVDPWRKELYPLVISVVRAARPLRGIIPAAQMIGIRVVSPPPQSSAASWFKLLGFFSTSRWILRWTTPWDFLHINWQNLYPSEDFFWIDVPCSTSSGRLVKMQFSRVYS